MSNELLMNIKTNHGAHIWTASVTSKYHFHMKTEKDSFLLLMCGLSKHILQNIFIAIVRYMTHFSGLKIFHLPIWLSGAHVSVTH